MHVAESVRENLPEAAILSCCGGEESVVLLPQHNLEQAEELAVSRTKQLARNRVCHCDSVPSAGASP